MAEPQVCRFGGHTHVGPRTRVLDGVQIPLEKGHLWGVAMLMLGVLRLLPGIEQNWQTHKRGSMVQTEQQHESR